MSNELNRERTDLRACFKISAEFTENGQKQIYSILEILLISYGQLNQLKLVQLLPNRFLPCLIECMWRSEVIK